jgi:uncharacterized integral membrane protein
MIRILIAAPFLALMVLFALSNPQPAKLGLWPTDYAIEVPLSLAILAAMGLAFFLGALLIWFSAVGARARARRAERQVRRLEAQLQEMKVRVIRPTAPMQALPAPATPSRSLAPVP